MKRKFTKFFLPIVALSMIMGAAGLQETICGLYADSTATEYVPLTNVSDSLVKVQIKNQAPTAVRLPNFTFLIPGFGTHERAWSNDLIYTPIGSNNPNCSTGTGDFCYNPDSVIAKIEEKTNSNVFVAERDSDDDSKFHLWYYPEVKDNASNIVSYGEKQEIRNIQSIDPNGQKHSIVVFSSSDPFQSNALEFDSFERIANRLCHDFNYTHHYIPKINLIGHSRGGLIAQEYANNYPYNVYSINTIATPFFGSETGKFLQRINNYPIFGPLFGLLGNGFLPYDGFTDLQDQQASAARRTTWNEVRQGAKIKANAYGSVLTLPFLSEGIVLSSLWSSNPVLNALPYELLNPIAEALEEINNHFVTSAEQTDFSKPIDYSRFESDCTPIDTAYAANKLKNAIMPVFYGIMDAINYLATLNPVIDPLAVLGTFIAGIEIECAVTDLSLTLAKNMCCYKGQVCVLKDDVLVSLDSQMCPGFSYYNRFVKVFDADYLDENNTFYSTEPMPIVGHNLETMNKDITESIVLKGSFANITDVQEDIMENHQWPVMERKGKINYYLNYNNYELHNGHGHTWGEFNATVHVQDVPQQLWDTIWAEDCDNYSNAEIFDTSIAYDGCGDIRVTLYVHPQAFYYGFVTINYTYKSELRLSSIQIARYPDNIGFIKGQTINFNGLEVKAIYSSGLELTLDESDYEIDFDENASQTVGTHFVTIKRVEKFEEIGQTFTIEKTCSFAILVRDPWLTSICLDYENCQTSFEVGDTFNYDGLQVAAYYDDNSYQTVTNFSVNSNSVNMYEPGVYPVTVSYTDNGITRTASYMVTVETPVLDSITLSGNYQTSFEVGDTFNYDGLVVTANYTSGYSREVTNYTVVTRTIDMNTAGTYTVRVRYTESGVTKSTTYQITVVYNGPTLTGITLSGNYQTEFEIGEQFNHTGLIVTAHYSDGTSAQVTGFSVSAFTYNALRPGNYLVYVNYSDNGGFALASYTVTVLGLTPIFLESITLSGNYKTNFRLGQAFNANGLIVTAHYTDGSSEVVTDFVIDSSEYDPFAFGTHTIRVIYTERFVTVETTYDVRVSGKIIDDPIFPPFPGGKF